MKSRPLVLIDEGHGHGRLTRACAHLRELGYTAWILRGGLNRWRAQGGPLEGDVFAQRELNRIPPRTFFAEREHGDWSVIYVSESAKTDTAGLIPHAVQIAYRGDPAEFISAFEGALGNRIDNPFMFILICDDRGVQYERMEKLLRKTGGRNVLYLKGGLEAYREFSHTLNLMHQPRTIVKADTEKCWINR